jgi:hypothetical protein
LDKYAILCIFTLVAQSIWHAIIGAIIFLHTHDNRVTPDSYFVHVDQIIFIMTIGLFVVGHIALIIWLYLVPLKHRKNMTKTSAQCEQLLSIKKRNKNNDMTRKNSRKSFPRISIEK